MANPFQEFNGVKYSLYSNSKYYANGKNRMHRVVWEYYNGPVPKGHVIHHKDENKFNNDISNLECMPKGKHSSMHGKEGWLLTPEGKKHNERIRELTKEWHKTEKGVNWHREHAKKTIALKVFSNTCEQCGRAYTYKSSIPKGKFCHLNCKMRALRNKRKQQIVLDL